MFVKENVWLKSDKIQSRSSCGRNKWEIHLSRRRHLTTLRCLNCYDARVERFIKALISAGISLMTALAGAQLQPLQTEEPVCPTCPPQTPPPAVSR